MPFSDAFRQELLAKVKDQMDKVQRDEMPIAQAAAALGMMPFELEALAAMGQRLVPALEKKRT